MLRCTGSSYRRNAFNTSNRERYKLENLSLLHVPKHENVALQSRNKTPLPMSSGRSSVCQGGKLDYPRAMCKWVRLFLRAHASEIVPYHLVTNDVAGRASLCCGVCGHKSCLLLPRAPSMPLKQGRFKLFSSSKHGHGGQNCARVTAAHPHMGRTIQVLSGQKVQRIKPAACPSLDRSPASTSVQKGRSLFRRTSPCSCPPGPSLRSACKGCRTPN